MGLDDGCVDEDQRVLTLLDKGFENALQAFTQAVANGGPAPIDENELIESSLATLAVLESLQTGSRIDLG